LGDRERERKRLEDRERERERERERDLTPLSIISDNGIQPNKTSRKTEQ